MFGRLYLKIFLSFVCVMLVTLVLVAGLFRHTQGQEFLGRFKRLAHAQVILVKSSVENSILLNHGSTGALQPLVDKLANIYRARLWITGQNNTVLARSFPGPIPTPQPENPEKEDEQRLWSQEAGANVILCGEDPKCLYVTIPFGGRDGVPPGTIHYLDQNMEGLHHEKPFFLGLISICAVVALLIMPVSRLITRRLKRLRRSALCIADGDLSHRAQIRGRDEVAELGQAINRMAHSLSRMIRASRELTANVSHELRTPLTRIRIAEEMLREQFGDKGTAHLDSIREDIEALDKLIGRLLTLSKLDLKEDLLTLEPVDLAELTEHVLDRLRPIAEHRNVNVSAQLPKDTVIHADGEVLLTGLNGILENGVKHATENGWLKVAISVKGNTAILTAENSHPPLPEEELTAIFEPFRRARGTRTQGTGLGLAIAYKTIMRHGGTLSAENTDEGILFTATLPIRR
ncbi:MULTISPECIES: HAMP domain-containing sensor histidine kinase [unclassified Pseudodesulfovibrio]|uniref:sensor histidine kinase n=1 Tax=unclassified Pseudodesulfovibrio TaxID=2661612 RepID=UPI000FEBE5A8|nr:MULTISPECIES: HAMP domain-containing sensor histidine kinase [unclassified Pseudodesulfovibrio]MCJ2165326.1 HAMP domain-containing histidine kinase [Pseudodesulfovibrio sp. S3-i]RWU02484.1 sensor histidine kinase [Pseudodesulfovibrio sp. S3]